LLKRTVIGDTVAHLKQQKLDVLIDFHALFHHYSAAGFYSHDHSTTFALSFDTEIDFRVSYF